MVASPVRVGIVGTGQMASDVHLPALLCATEIEVAWVSDRDDAKSRLIADSFGVPHAPLPGDPVELPPADIVLLAIPYGVRDPYYAALGSRGTAIYVEKPFARSLAEHDAHCKPFAPHAIAVGYKMRATGAARTLREATASQLFGRLESATVRFGWPGVSTSGRYSSSLAMAGGGLLFEVACHYLDLALWVAGASAVELTDGHMETELGFDVHTEAVGSMTSPTGPVQLDVLVTNLHHTTMSLVYRYEHGEVTLNTWRDGIPRLRPHGSSHDIELRGLHCDYPRSAAQMTHEHWLEFVHAFRAQTPNEACAQASRVTTSLIEQLYALAKPEAGSSKDAR